MSRWQSAHRTSRSVDMRRVSSSNVHSALFDEDERGMYVRFLRSGSDDIYVYPAVDPSLWTDFLDASSKGAWIWDNMIRESHPYELLTTRDWATAFEPSEFPADAREVLFP